jgi:hypothetical protein
MMFFAWFLSAGIVLWRLGDRRRGFGWVVAAGGVVVAICVHRVLAK